MHHVRDSEEASGKFPAMVPCSPPVLPPRGQDPRIHTSDQGRQTAKFHLVALDESSPVFTGKSWAAIGLPRTGQISQWSFHFHFEMDPGIIETDRLGQSTPSNFCSLSNKSASPSAAGVTWGLRLSACLLRQARTSALRSTQYTQPWALRRPSSVTEIAGPSKPSLP